MASQNSGQQSSPRRTDPPATVSASTSTNTHQYATRSQGSISPTGIPDLPPSRWNYATLPPAPNRSQNRPQNPTQTTAQHTAQRTAQPTAQPIAQPAARPAVQPTAQPPTHDAVQHTLPPPALPLPDHALYAQHIRTHTPQIQSHRAAIQRLQAIIRAQRHQTHTLQTQYTALLSDFQHLRVDFGELRNQHARLENQWQKLVNLVLSAEFGARARGSVLPGGPGWEGVVQVVDPWAGMTDAEALERMEAEEALAALYIDRDDDSDVSSFDIEHYPGAEGEREGSWMEDETVDVLGMAEEEIEEEGKRVTEELRRWDGRAEFRMNL